MIYLLASAPEAIRKSGWGNHSRKSLIN